MTCFGTLVILALEHCMTAQDDKQRKPNHSISQHGDGPLSIPARPFRADHVGSLLRPGSLKQAREKDVWDPAR
jgi:hypothetical protein